MTANIPQEHKAKALTKKVKRKSNGYVSVFVMSIICLCLVLFWLFTPYWVYLADTNLYLKKIPEYGQIGDMFGIVNALFSGLAFAALIYTIKLQRDEIKESKTQGRYTRFTDEFFKFIDLHNNVYDQLNSPLAYYEEKQIKNPRINVGDSGAFIKYYRDHVEKQDVIKNFGNYLKIFEVTVNFIVTRKTLWKSRDKYFTIYFGMFHRNEKRFLIYHYNLTAEKPKHWEILKNYLYLDFSLAHIEEKEFKDILGLKD